MLKARSGHIRMKKAKYQDLAEIFPDIFNSFLEVTGQDLEEEAEVNNMLLQVNLWDLKKNRKPEGFNRQRATRMIFPLTNKVELYVYDYIRGMEVVQATEMISRKLEDAGIENVVTWDELVVDELKRKKALAAR
ncbi:MAG: hypothetical protein KAT70_07125 [Thermoplasmata archaeon]|nr:hypothetical protein [Thermoplasmata archaeon]